MGVAPLAIEVTVVCCLAGYLLHYYGNWKKQHIVVTVAAFVAWYFSFLIIFTLPLDISNTCYRQCMEDSVVLTTTVPVTLPANLTNTTEVSPPESNLSGFSLDPASITGFEQQPLSHPCKQPWSYVSVTVLDNLWHVVYWTSQVLTWLVIPLMQSYSNAGDFTVLGKLKTGLIENAIYYGLYLLIFGICLIYIAVRPDIKIDGKSLKVLATTASNTWGLTLLVLMWGYGLVEVPRRMWNNSHKGRMLNYTYFKLSKLSVEKTEAEESLEDVLDEVKKGADAVRYNHPLRKNVETILDKCPEATQQALRRGTRDDYQDFHNPTDIPTEKSLVKLHKKVIRATQAQSRTKCQWIRFMQRAFQLEELALNQSSSRREFRRSSDYNGIFRHCYSAKLEWYWKCVIYPWTLRILSIVLAIFSAMVVWSECLFFVRSPTLSLFAIFLDLAKANYNYVAIEIMCILTMAYLSVCAYYTVFKVRFFNYYYLAGHHQTNEYSLLFCGMMLTRLTPPLCLNFLSLIHLDSHITKDDAILETSFTKIMGHMDVIKFISEGFNIYYPIAIVLLCFATYFNLCGRVLHFLGFQQFMSDDEMTQELCDEGKNLVSRDRRKQERQEETAARRQEWSDRFGTREYNNRLEDQEMDEPVGLNRMISKQPISEYGSTLHAHSSHVSQTENSDGKEVKDKKANSKKSKDTTKGGNDVYTVTDGKHTVARSPQESDRSNLLRDAEPMAYTDPPNQDPFEEDPFSENFSRGVHGAVGGYQSRAVRPTTLRTSIPAPGRETRNPPKGIFDDI